MKVTAMIANHAEAQNNTLYLMGGGVDSVTVEPDNGPPYPTQFGIGLLITIPWGEANQTHRVTIDLVDADGREVLFPTGPDTAVPFHVEFTCAVGRPPHLQVGDDQTVANAFNVPILAFPALGKYRFAFAVDGEIAEQLPFTVRSQSGLENAPPAQQGPLGPGDLPQL